VTEPLGSRSQDAALELEKGEYHGDGSFGLRPEEPETARKKTGKRGKRRRRVRRGPGDTKSVKRRGRVRGRPEKSTGVKIFFRELNDCLVTVHRSQDGEKGLWEPEH